MRPRILLGAALIAIAAIAGVAAPSALAKKPLVVCKQGCDYRTIQDAVDDSGKKAVIEVEPGKYKEGVIVKGHKHDGLTIKGTNKKKPKKVILEGKNAKGPAGLAQNGIEGIKVNGLKVKNLWVRNYATNGIFVHECSGYKFDNVIASFNRAYGLFSFDCTGGKMLNSVGYGHGDSAFYVGATPPQDNPKPTVLKNLEAYQNVLGFSGTNARYVQITDGDYYNNGVGIVPSTLDSEPYEPSENGVIENNNIFWNNFNYFAPGSPVATVSAGLGELEGVGTIQFPTGVGVAMLGTTGWTIQNNNIFGNFKWGLAILSDPFNEGNNAIPFNNQTINNQMGRGGTDTNAVDFFSYGAGKGNCFSGNSSSTFDPSPSATDAELYPECPGTDVGYGDAFGNGDQFGELAVYVTQTPPEKQQCSWTNHPHPPFEDFEPYEVPGVVCP